MEFQNKRFGQKIYQESLEISLAGFSASAKQHLDFGGIWYA